MKTGGSKLKKIGLVMSRGVGKGSYQNGCWKVIEELGIEIIEISGTSVGEKKGSKKGLAKFLGDHWIGYGDIHPTGWLKLYAGVEGIFGILLMSLLLTTNGKRYYGKD